MGDGLNVTFELAVVDGRGAYAVPRVPYAVRIDRFTPAQFGADRNLSQPLRLAYHQPGSFVLVDHHEGRAEPACRVFDDGCLVRVIHLVITGALCKVELGAA